MKKKKTIMTLSLLACLAVPTTFMLAGCNGNTHEHTYGEWSKDANEHWKQCTVKNCDNIIDKDYHAYTDKNDKDCNTCGYIRVAEDNNFAFANTVKSVIYSGEPVSFVRNTDFTIKGDDEDIVVEYKVKDAEDSTYTTTPFKNVGEYTARVSFAGNAMYKAVTENNTMNFEITPKAIDSSQQFSFAYNGTTIFTASASDIEGVPSADDIGIKFTANSKNVGAKLSSVTLTGASAGNYTINKDNVNFKITKKVISSYNKKFETGYTGNMQFKIATANIDEVIDKRNEDINILVVMTGKDVGTQQINYEYTKLQGRDSVNYKLDMSNASVEVVPIQISDYDMVKSFVYNGTTNFTVPGGDITSVIDADKAFVNIEYTAKDKNVGESKLESITLTGTASKNYKLISDNAGLTITKAPLSLTGLSLTAYGSTSNNSWQNSFELNHENSSSIKGNDKVIMNVAVEYSGEQNKPKAGSTINLYPTQLTGSSSVALSAYQTGFAGADAQNYELDTTTGAGQIHYVEYATTATAKYSSYSTTYAVKNIAYGDTQMVINLKAPASNSLYDIIKGFPNAYVDFAVRIWANGDSIELGKITKSGLPTQYIFTGGSIDTTGDQPANINLNKNVVGFTDSEGKWIYTGGEIELSISISPTAYKALSNQETPENVISSGETAYFIFSPINDGTYKIVLSKNCEYELKIGTADGEITLNSDKSFNAVANEQKPYIIEIKITSADVTNCYVSFDSQKVG